MLPTNSHYSPSVHSQHFLFGSQAGWALGQWPQGWLSGVWAGRGGGGGGHLHLVHERNWSRGTKTIIQKKKTSITQDYFRSSGSESGGFVKASTKCKEHTHKKQSRGNQAKLFANKHIIKGSITFWNWACWENHTTVLFICSVTCLGHSPACHLGLKPHYSKCF